MILYNKRFEELVDKINKIQHMEIDIAVYMEITNNNDINLYIANNLSHATYSIKHAVATCDNLSSEEAAVITIHTDTVCCDFDYAQKYADKLLGESTWTHDFADKKLVAKLKELSKSDFIKIFENLTDE